MARRGRRPGSPTMGASIEQTGPDTYRIRWSQVEDGKRRHPQTTVRGTRADAEERRALVIRDVQEKGYHNPDEHRARYAPPANLTDGLLAWLDAAKADGTALPGEDAARGGLAPSTVYRYQGRILALLAAIHEAEGIPKDEPLPVTLLRRPLFDRLNLILARRGPTVPAQSLDLLWQAWTWMGDDPASWPQIPQQPRLKKGFVPSGRTYGATVAPTLDHTGAVLRHLAGMRVRRDAVGVAVAMRYTGLRVAQVLGIHREDIDLAAGTLVVRIGKSKREKAEKRAIPLSKHLLAEPLVRAAIERAKPGESVFRTAGSQFVAKAWEAATEAGEVPRHTWAPTNRAHARPNHAFRAALVAHLTAEHVASDVIGLLVGHAHGGADTLRATYYGRSLEEEAREVVDSLPPIDWTGPELPEGVVQFDAAVQRQAGGGV